MNIILRRRKLGRTSCREICKGVKDLVVVRNDKPTEATKTWFVSVDTLFRWGCTSSLEELGIKAVHIINSAAAIHTVNSKGTFREILAGVGLAPKTFVSGGGDDNLSLPVIIRPVKHAQGKHCYYCDTYLQMAMAIEEIKGDYYISEYIPKVAEYRVFVAQDRAVWVAKKIPKDPVQIAWNVAQGATFENVSWGDWPLKVIKNAIKCHQLSGLDFSGVDMMVGPDGGVYCLEINSA